MWVGSSHEVSVSLDKWREKLLSLRRAPQPVICFAKSCLFKWSLKLITTEALTPVNGNSVMQWNHASHNPVQVIIFVTKTTDSTTSTNFMKHTSICIRHSLNCISRRKEKCNNYSGCSKFKFGLPMSGWILCMASWLHTVIPLVLYWVKGILLFCVL